MWHEWGEKELILGFRGRFEKKRPLGRPTHNKSIILKQELKEWNEKLWTGFIRLRIERSNVFL
jgi:hypothetical protein